MSIVARLLFAFSVAWVANGFAVALHIPWWRDFGPADRADTIVCTFVACWLISAKPRYQTEKGPSA